MLLLSRSLPCSQSSVGAPGQFIKLCFRLRFFDEQTRYEGAHHVEEVTQRAFRTTIAQIRLAFF